MYISQSFEELQASNLEFQLYTPTPIITGTYFDTVLSRFGFPGLPAAAILDFQMSMSQPFKEP